MNAEIRFRDKEILRLKAKLKKAEAERASAEAAFESKCDLLTKREAELKALWEAVASYFKCFDWRDNCTLSTPNSHKQKLIRETKHAEQQLRGMIGGEDETTKNP